MLNIFTANTPHATALCVTFLALWIFAGVLTAKTITSPLKESHKKRSKKKC